jgi:hypothetical protein
MQKNYKLHFTIKKNKECVGILYILGLQIFLLSIGYMIEQGCVASFNDKNCLLVNKYHGKIILAK